MILMMLLAASRDECITRCSNEGRALVCSVRQRTCASLASDDGERASCAQSMTACLDKVDARPAFDRCVEACTPKALEPQSARTETPPAPVYRPAPRGVPPAAPAAPACSAGQRLSPDTEGHCCWPGQAWGNEKCVGLPSECPEGLVPSQPLQSCVAPECLGGRVRARDGVHCCWPEQAWSTARGTCLGNPVCPAGTVLNGSEDTCVEKGSAPFVPVADTGKPQAQGSGKVVAGIVLLSLGALFFTGGMLTFLIEKDLFVVGALVAASGLVLAGVGVPVLIVGVNARGNTTQATVALALRWP